VGRSNPLGYNARMRAAIVPTLAALLAPARSQDGPSPVDGLWQTDFAAARKAAAEQGRPLLLLFRCER
jgi:hypothetical protein